MASAEIHSKCQNSRYPWIPLIRDLGLALAIPQTQNITYVTDLRINRTKFLFKFTASGIQTWIHQQQRNCACTSMPVKHLIRTAVKNVRYLIWTVTQKLTLTLITNKCVTHNMNLSSTSIVIATIFSPRFCWNSKSACACVPT